MSGIFDFEDELRDSEQKLKSCHSKINRICKNQEADSEQLRQLYSEIINLADNQEVPLEGILEPQKSTTNTSDRLKWDDEFLLNYNPLIIESKVKEEVLRNPELLPPLSSLDYGIVGVAGLVATLLDFLVVKIPKEINYLGKYKQDGSSFTQLLRTLGVDRNGQLNPFLQWCEETCKVPYDQSINPGIKGFNPKSHRLLNLGHDPLFGLIFGTLDILNGSMTAFDINGNLQILKTFDLPLTGKVFAPLIWLGHIVSDMCTKMGIPIPGWGFMQLMQFGLFGSNKSLADISRWMYLNGYDIRHFVTMSISPAVIEIIIRGYHYISSLETSEQLQYSMYTSLANKEITQIRFELRLHKMLFLAHAIAAGGNAVKVFSHSGNPLAINLTQWILLLKESIQIIKAVTRDKTTEKIIRNRQQINRKWKEIENITLKNYKILSVDSTIY